MRDGWLGRQRGRDDCDWRARRTCHLGRRGGGRPSVRADDRYRVSILRAGGPKLSSDALHDVGCVRVIAVTDESDALATRVIDFHTELFDRRLVVRLRRSSAPTRCLSLASALDSDRARSLWAAKTRYGPARRSGRVAGETPRDRCRGDASMTSPRCPSRSAWPATALSRRASHRKPSAH